VYRSHIEICSDAPRHCCMTHSNRRWACCLTLSHSEAGHFTNVDTKYYAAPQRLNSTNDIMGHPHFVIEQLSSVTSTFPLDPSKFVFFKGMNTAADRDGNVSVNMTDSLPAGIYKLSSINSSANHSPVLVAVAQHGSLDDQVYVRIARSLHRNLF